MLTPYPLESPPPLPPLDEPWEGDAPPLHSGRRVRVVEAGRFEFGPGGRLERVAGPGGVERWCVALEEPCLLWQGDAPGEVVLVATLYLDDPTLHVERSTDGATAWITGEGSRREFLVGCRGGALTVTEVPGGVELVAVGSASVRMIVVAAEDEGDRERTLRALARKGARGLLTQRREHRTRLHALATRMTTPEPERNEAFVAQTDALDAELVEGSAGRRSFAAPLRVGTELLARGVREPVRDVLRAPFTDMEALALFARYADWCGDDDFVRKHWPRAEQAVREAAPGPARALAAQLLLPIAEALGDGGSVASLEGIVATSAPTPHEALPDALAEWWGLHPIALEGALGVAPSLPEGWPEMTLERLRVGASVVDLRVRRRPAGIAVKARLVHGPALSLHLAPRLPFTPTGVLLGDDQFPGPTVRFLLENEAEGIWLA